MMITREEDYGFRIIRALASGEKMTVNEICGQEIIPAAFTYKILKKLSQSGLVEIIRGAGGGYILGRPLESITLLDITTAIDGDLVLNKCQAAGFKCEYVECNSQCIFYTELNRIQRMLEVELSSKSIAELLEEQDRLRYTCRMRRRTAAAAQGSTG